LAHFRKGYLSDYFGKIAIKRLTAVEVDPGSSNQHEFEGVQKLRSLLGTPSEKQRFDSRFVWIDDDDGSMTVNSFVTWSDVRKNHPRRSEYHLYYSVQAAEVVHRASPGDLLLVCRERNGDLLVVMTPAGGTVERQLAWMFDFPLDDTTVPLVRDIDLQGDREILYPSRFILDELGIEYFPADEDYLQLLLDRFDSSFPTTKEFSAFARETLHDVSVHDNADAVLLAWIDHEERLFRTLEKHIVSERLKSGFYGEAGPDVDGFIAFSLSVQNRRKSRAGHALENHLEPILHSRNIRYDRGKKTEGNKKPDFIFPGVAEYQNPDFPDEKLTILAAKSSCKDRWRQVLSEAARVRNKHLLTLEPGISENQTDEMRGESLQLIVPSGIFESYTPGQREWLMDVESFLARVKKLQ
jgi:hypothetical protein